MNRRKFLTLVGGGIVLAAGGVGGFAATRTPHQALSPWNAAGKSPYTEPRMRALSYAVLAPNPHNMQPWQIELVGDDRIVLTVDETKLLPHTDPFNRQITIGLGCFLELMKMAAAQDGYGVLLDLFPGGEHSERVSDSPIAIATFTKNDNLVPDPLFNFVMQRRSNKEPYDTAKSIEPAKLDALLTSNRHDTSLGGSVEKASVEELRALTEEAIRIETLTPRTHKESVDVFRIGKRAVNANPDGIDFSGVFFETLAAVGQFDRDVLLDPSSTAFKQGMDIVLENPRTAMGHVWMVTKDNSRRSQIAAGADWLRLNLEAARQGIAFQPLSQIIQEYQEMASLYADIHKRLAPDGGTVQMLGRIGYGPEVPISPRWPIDAKIVTS